MSVTSSRLASACKDPNMSEEEFHISIPDDRSRAIRTFGDMVETSLINDVAGAHSTMVALVVVFGVAALTVVPSLAWLYTLVQHAPITDRSNPSTG